MSVANRERAFPGPVVAAVQEVRDFLSGLRRELPELFAAPRQPSSAPASGDLARELFSERVRHWSAVLGVAPQRVFMKNQRTLWGSCSARGNLNFNRVLAGAPPEVVDYVVIHELAHLREMNHSPSFWAIVGRWCPEQKRHRRWLRQNISLLARRS